MHIKLQLKELFLAMDLPIAKSGRGAQTDRGMGVTLQAVRSVHRRAGLYVRVIRRNERL